jgi:hypothetical protein
MNPAKDMELRDWFAAHALAAILQSPNTPRPGDTDFEVHTAHVAEQAYAYADALLKEKDRRKRGRAGE